VAKFGSAEEFWQIYSFLKRPDQLPQGTNMQLFVDGIKPMWEDEANKNGGRWTLRVSKGYANKLWEDLILAMIGEQFSLENEINGIVLSIRG
jgi:translation initiation factor 4E